MSLTGWVVIGVLVMIFLIDWLIVLGLNPRKWKGGDKDEIDRID